MNRKTIYFLIIFLIFWAEPGRTISIGEYFGYKVKWNNLPVGSAELEVLDTTEIQGCATYHVVNRVWTEGVVGVFFKVENVVESFIDMEELFSRRYVKNIKEGRYRDTLLVNFDQTAHLAIKEDTTFTIPENVQDPLSILWYFRQQSLKEGEIISLPYSDGKRNHTLEVRILKKEEISTPLGKFSTDVIEFSVGGKERQYLKKEVRLKVWFSDDEMRMPILIKAKASVGSITGVLVKSNKIVIK